MASPSACYPNFGGFCKDAIYEVVASESPRHWVVLGSDAQRGIEAKLDMLRAEFEAGADTARSTDYPGSAKAIL